MVKIDYNASFPPLTRQPNGMHKNIHAPRPSFITARRGRMDFFLESGR